MSDTRKVTDRRIAGVNTLPAATPPSGAYAAYHRTCNHTVAIHAQRASLETLVSRLTGSGRYALRIRRATTDDYDNVSRGITCNMCRSLT